MAYQTLYRKYRPQTFDEVKGQDAIVRVLKNQINNNRLSHAYLFVGTRGTGKTSIAKLFARAINCENPKDGIPCNECASCKAALNGTSMNVIEMDAASNNGVDHVRRIIDDHRVIGVLRICRHIRKQRLARTAVGIRPVGVARQESDV